MEMGSPKPDSPLSDFVSSLYLLTHYEEIGEGKWGGANSYELAASTTTSGARARSGMRTSSSTLSRMQTTPKMNMAL